MSLDYILNRPREVVGAGYIHPILLKDWDEFDSYANILLYSKENFRSGENFQLLDLILGNVPDQEKLIQSLKKIFQFCFQKENVELFVNSQDSTEYYFEIDKMHKVDKYNYEEVRNIIIMQNIILVPKVYKDPRTQKWVEKVLKTRQKNSPTVTLEDMVTTVSVMKGVHYWDLENYSMYQLRSDFDRICKMKDNEYQSLMFANPYADMSKTKIIHFAESLDLYKSPYDDVFKDQSQMKINKAVQQ